MNERHGFGGPLECRVVLIHSPSFLPVLPPCAVQVGSEKKTAILDEHDPIWKELRDLFLADVRAVRCLFGCLNFKL